MSFISKPFYYACDVAREIGGNWGLVEHKKEPDPVSILAVAALCAYSEPGTRMGKTGHHVFLERPLDYPALGFGYDGSYTHGGVRWIKGESHDQLPTMISSSIKKVANAFKKHVENEKDDDPVKIFFGHVEKGLDDGLKKQTYEEAEQCTADAITTWATKIKAILSNGVQDNGDRNLVDERISELWNITEIAVLNSYFMEIKKGEQKKESFDTSIKKIEDLLKSKAKMLDNM